MEGSSGDAIASALRWVKYGDVYYAALIVPEIEAPSEVPDGHEFVYFLGDESGAVVPSSDVEPFDPNMRERATHPEAIAGVRAAEQLLLAAEASGAETGQTLAPANRKEKRRGMQQAKAVGKGMKNKNGYGENNGDKSYGRFSKGDGDAWNGDEVAVARADVSGVAVDHGVSSAADGGNQNGGSGDLDRMESEFNLTPTPEGLDPLSAAKVGHRGRVHGITDLFTSFRGANSESEVDPLILPYLGEIRYHYNQVVAEAVEKKCLVNLQEQELIRIVKSQLVSVRTEAAYLRQLLLEMEQVGSENEEMMEEVASLHSRVKTLESSFAVEKIVKQHLHCRDVPVGPRDRKRPDASGSFGPSFMSSFTDTSLTFLRDAAAVAAAPREPGKDLIVRYRRQRLRREELLANQQGLGKLGLMIPRGQVMEKWRRSRELMVLDPLSSSQPVSRRFSESLKKIEEHALKCLTNSSKERGTQVQSTLIRQQQLPPALYNFHDLRMDNTRRQEGFPTDGPPAFGSSGKEDGRQWGNELTDTNHVDEAEQGLCVPLISPLRTSFDPRATFATDADVINRENIVAEELALRSKQYSQSICFPSHESQWERSEAYDAAGSIHNGSSVAHSQRHHRSGRSTSRRGSMSRASSRASSVALEASVGAERKRARSNASIASNTSQTRHDWRALAKRAILQQLTLYLRGINSRPKVLNEEQFKATAKKLLERAMRTGSERLGLSMSLQANNANVPFTKDTETRLRKSVDNYVSRHYVCGRAPVQQLQNSEGLVTGRQSATRSQDDDDDDTRSVMGAHLHATDSPVYDQ